MQCLSTQEIEQLYKVEAIDCVKIFLETYWKSSLEKCLNVFPQTNLSIDGLITQLSGSKQFLLHLGIQHFNENKSNTLLREKFSKQMIDEVYDIFLKTYFNYIKPFLPPSPSLTKGHFKFYFIQSINFPKMGGISPQNVSTEVLELCKLPISSEPINHLVLIINSPIDLMKHSSKWEEDDNTIFHHQNINLNNTNNNIENVKKPEEIKLRGKHELIHGAYSTTPSILPQHLQINQDFLIHHHDVQKGGDKIFNTLIRSLYKWLSLSQPGYRRISLISTSWKNGIDFELYLDGNSNYSINHYSLQETISSQIFFDSTNQSIMNRIQLSFDKKFIIEYSSQSTSSRTVKFNTSNNLGLHSPLLDFIPHIVENSSSLSSSISSSTFTSTSTSILPPVLKIINSKIIDLSDQFISIEVELCGKGELLIHLIEVPTFATTVDIMRLFETEFINMDIISTETKIISNQNKINLQFNNLTSYCAYAIYFQTSIVVPTPFIEQELIHFRTYFHQSKNPDIVTCVLRDND